MSEERKPCPFCGGESVQGMFDVWCDHCGAETAKDVDANETQVSEKWNKRATIRRWDF